MQRCGRQLLFFSCSFHLLVYQMYFSSVLAVLRTRLARLALKQSMNALQKLTLARSTLAATMATKRKTGQTLSLKGSVKTVTDFFEYSVNSCVFPPRLARAVAASHTLSHSYSILYQRGIYPPEDFKMVKKYGLTLFTSADESLERYVSSVMKQVQSESQLVPSSFPIHLLTPVAPAAWMMAGKLDSLALIIMSRETREVVERWQFDIEVEEPPTVTAEGGKAKENEACVPSVLGTAEVRPADTPLAAFADRKERH